MKVNLKAGYFQK